MPITLGNLSGFEPAATQPPLPRKGALWDLTELFWRHNGRLVAKLDDENKSVWIEFENVITFRCQDEGDMLDYWSVREKEGAKITSVYKVTTNPFLDELRGSGVSGLKNLQHLLLISHNFCCDVIGGEDISYTVRLSLEEKDA